MRVFVKIADAGNLSAAGRQLGLSLTSVSRQLMALEEVLGTTLVERTTRHLSLTDGVRSTLLRTGEADFGGGRRGGTRPDDADGSRIRPVACERSVAARSVAVGANAARLSSAADSGLGRSDAGGSAGTSRRGRCRCCPSHWTAGRQEISGHVGRGQVRCYRKSRCDRRLLPLYIQNSFFGTAAGGPAPCFGTERPQCAGTFDGISAAVDWRFAPKWDLYWGIMFTQANGGLAYGFLQRNNIDPMVGLRFRF
jgi:Bacterial regulatory helix-turn-helix protein, lysR family